jgi:hypothetical protein
MCMTGFLAATASATIITSNTGGTANGNPSFYGQSFTTPSGTAYDDISFNYFSNLPPTTPTAAGTLYLLSSAYTGTPAALSSSATGFIASSTGISGGMYLFAPTVTLQPGTQYFVYGDTLLSNITGGNIFAGQTSYYALTPASAFAGNGGVSANFQVSGTAVTSGPGPDTVPEPVSMLLVLPALGALFVINRGRLAS